MCTQASFFFSNQKGWKEMIQKFDKECLLLPKYILSKTLTHPFHNEVK